MNRIIVDLEMNEIMADKFPKEREISKFEIIEIGAVKLDEKLNVTDGFKRYVRPVINPMGERYIDLTGITDEMLKNESEFSEVMDDFIEWCGNDYMIYSWGSMDKTQVENEIKLKKYKRPEVKYMLKNWVDFQAKFSKILGISKHVSLKDAINYTGYEFEGEIHDAYWDAKNTASVYIVAQDENKLRKIMKPYVDSMKINETMTYSLGEVMKNIIKEK